jgi:hypothetical protein
MSAKRSAAARRRELWWILGTVVTVLVLAGAATIAMPFLTSLGGDL